ncbi:MAG: CatB-related O-acetyltransferase [Gemmobacter sp.]
MEWTPQVLVWTKDFIAEKYPRRPDIAVGEHSYGRVKIRGTGRGLTIGRYCSIAAGLTVFLGGQHRTDFVTTYPFNRIDTWPDAKDITGHPFQRGPVNIGNDVWFGADVTIVQGVTIGDGAIIGGSAIVAKDVAPYAIHVGNPARFVRYRFDEATVAALLDIRWWDWPDEKVARATHDLMSTDIQVFIDKARSGTYDA